MPSIEPLLYDQLNYSRNLILCSVKPLVYVQFLTAVEPNNCVQV